MWPNEVSRLPGLVGYPMIKERLSKGLVGFELRLERSQLFDISRKHQNLSIIFYGEKIYLHVIYRQTDEEPFKKDLIDSIVVNLEEIVIENNNIQVETDRVRSNLSLMRIKSAESLNLPTSETSLVSPTSSTEEASNSVLDHHGTIIYSDDSTVVWSIPVPIPLLNDNDDDMSDDDKNSRSMSKLLKLSVSVSEQLLESSNHESLLNKTKPYGNYKFVSYLQQLNKYQRHILKPICTMEKKIELIDPLMIHISTTSSERKSISINTEVTSSSALKDIISVESFELRLKAYSNNPLIAHQFAITTSGRVSLPMILDKESFKCSHLLKVIDEDADNILTVNGSFLVKYEEKLISMEYESDLDISQHRPSRHPPRNSVTIRAESLDQDIFVNQPFLLELTIHHQVDYPTIYTAAFPINSSKDTLISLEPEVKIGRMEPFSSRTFYTKFLPLASGEHCLDCLQLVNGDNCVFTPEQSIRIHVKSSM